MERPEKMAPLRLSSKAEIKRNDAPSILDSLKEDEALRGVKEFLRGRKGKLDAPSKLTAPTNTPTTTGTASNNTNVSRLNYKSSANGSRYSYTGGKIEPDCKFFFRGFQLAKQHLMGILTALSLRLNTQCQIFDRNYRTEYF